MKSLLFFLFLLLSISTCPNDCNQHGICNPDGTCLCYKQTGMALNGAYFEDFSYTGADCSLRTCPRDFAFAGTSNEMGWDENDGVEMKITKEEPLKDDCDEPVPCKSYFLKLTVDRVDPALEEYGLGGSLTCYSKSHRHGFIGSYSIILYENETLYAVRDIGEKPAKSANEQYCFVDYVRKDLSLFVNFQLTSKGNYEETVFRDDLSQILMSYRLGSDLYEEDPTRFPVGKTIEPTSEPVSGQVVSIACLDDDMKVMTYTANLYRKKCEAIDSSCLALSVVSKDHKGKCFLLEGGFNSNRGIHRNITLESSELFNMLGLNKDHYFGKHLTNSAVGYFVPGDLNSDSYFGTTNPAQDLGTFQQPLNEPGNFTTGTNITFGQFCPALRCVKQMTKDPIKSYGDYFQYLVPGAHVTVLRLLTTREVEDKSGVGKPTSNVHYAVEDHACYSHLIQLTIKSVLTDVETGTATLTFNRPYTFGGESTFNHYAFLFQFHKIGPHTAIECSGQGECDRITGVCKCMPGFTGDSCQRINCPNDCSNHGTCLPLPELYPKEDYSNSGFGGVGSTLLGCKCELGYRGNDCSLITCPTGVDPVGGVNIKPTGTEKGPFVTSELIEDCSGRGICDYTTGTCSCFPGYEKSDCSQVNVYQ